MFSCGSCIEVVEGGSDTNGVLWADQSYHRSELVAYGSHKTATAPSIEATF